MTIFLLSMACILNSFSVIWLANKVQFKKKKKVGKKNAL